MEIKMPTIKELFSYLIVLGFITLLTYSLIYSMAKEICEESELKPVRYESQGLFGVLTPIETTPENADEYSKVCVKKGEVNFWDMGDTIEYLVEKTVEEQKNK